MVSDSSFQKAEVGFDRIELRRVGTVEDAVCLLLAEYFAEHERLVDGGIIHDDHDSSASDLGAKVHEGLGHEVREKHTIGSVFNELVVDVAFTAQGTDDSDACLLAWHLLTS